MKKAMQRSRCILALLSSRWVSKSGYVQKELREALEMLEHLPPERILIIPVRLDKCEPPHEQLRDLQWIDLFESYDEGLEQIVQAFRFSAESAEAYNRPLAKVPPVRPEPVEGRVIMGNDIAQLRLSAGSGRTDSQDSQEASHLDATAKSFATDLGQGVTLELVAIPGGTFWMGSPDGEGEKDEHPRHQVTVAPFYMGKYPVTQAQWQAVMGNNPSRFKGADRPVENVSWNGCQEFMQKLNATVETHGRASLQFRLPTEAEWEYACRAGSETIWHFGDDPAQLGKYAWFDKNSDSETHSVGQLQPNAFGLYDMHGNVREWCADTWHKSYDGAPTDGSAWERRDSDWRMLRVLRGGSRYSDAESLRCAVRLRDDWLYLRLYIWGFCLVCSRRVPVSPF